MQEWPDTTALPKFVGVRVKWFCHDHSINSREELRAFLTDEIIRANLTSNPSRDQEKHWIGNIGKKTMLAMLDIAGIKIVRRPRPSTEIIRI